MITSGVRRILEWEGSKFRRRRGGRGWGGGVPLPTGGRALGWDCAPPQKISSIFMENTIF